MRGSGNRSAERRGEEPVVGDVAPGGFSGAEPALDPRTGRGEERLEVGRNVVAGAGRVTHHVVDETHERRGEPRVDRLSGSLANGRARAVDRVQLQGAVVVAAEGV